MVKENEAYKINTKKMSILNEEKRKINTKI